MNFSHRRARRSRRTAMQNIVASFNAFGTRMGNVISAARGSIIAINGTRLHEPRQDRTVCSYTPTPSPRSCYDLRDHHSGSRFPQPDRPYRHLSNAITRIAMYA